MRQEKQSVVVGQFESTPVAAYEMGCNLWFLPFLFRAFSVFSVYSVVILAGKNHRIHGKHGIKRNKNQPLFKVNHHRRSRVFPATKRLC